MSEGVGRIGYFSYLNKSRWKSTGLNRKTIHWSPSLSFTTGPCWRRRSRRNSVKVLGKNRPTTGDMMTCPLFTIWRVNKLKTREETCNYTHNLLQIIDIRIQIRMFVRFQLFCEDCFRGLNLYTMYIYLLEKKSSVYRCG